MPRIRPVTAATALALAASAGGAWAQTPAPAPGPDAARCADPAYRCPDLRMERPYEISAGRTLGGRTLLYSANAIYSLGRGPVVIEGRRRSARTMFVRQRIYTANGHVSVPRPGARVVFKGIPGQGGYWKFQAAARMELWSTGPGRRRVRSGEKLVYCFRDLKRTQPLQRSPRRRIFGACSRDPGARRVLLGTSIGWADIYPASYYEQYIDVSGLRGCFELWHIADPADHLIETDESNNAAATVVRLPFRRGTAGRCR